MGSRREEERNEKIIRGLMKLPPNRRCINCNSLGPQYVCTNFWSFVCMTCSGIHREFTHRVKSVSMSKFTSQEVEALQAGGNQRAREIYLKSWDLQRQRLPDNSNVEKVREFIKSVYIEKKFSGGSIPSKPPRDLQSIRSLDNETRRASSYHSYSQSPPYDFQYEDRVYGNHGATLTRKPGSDRGIYVGKMASFICSPTRFNEDGFANEGSVPRFSDYSASSVGDPFRSGAESPSFQKDTGCASPVQLSKDTLAESRAPNLFAEAKTKKDAEIIHRPQRTMSSGSVGTLSIKSDGLNHEPEIDARCQLDNMAKFSPSAASWTNSTVDLFELPVVPPSDAHATAAIDLFQLPGAPPPPSTNLFQEAPQSQVSSTDVCSPSHTSARSSSGPFGGDLWQPLVSPFDKESVVDTLGPANEGWANFDSPPPATSMQGPQNLTNGVLPSGIGSSMAFDALSPQTTEMQWPQLQSFCSPESSLISDFWKEPLHNFLPPIEPIDAQAWNAFDDHSTMQPLSIRPVGELQSAADESMPIANQQSVNLVLQENTDNNVPKDAAYGEFPVHAVNVEFSLGAAYLNPLMENSQSDATSHKSANPFDLPFDSDAETEHMFLDMSSLQAALPNSQLPAMFLEDVNQQWFPPDPVPSYIQTAAAQGGLAYMAGQAPATKLGNIQPEGPVASIGGNPFD